MRNETKLALVGIAALAAYVWLNDPEVREALVTASHLKTNRPDSDTRTEP
jgi:hypothetical protein